MGKRLYGVTFGPLIHRSGLLSQMPSRTRNSPMPRITDIVPYTVVFDLNGVRDRMNRVMRGASISSSFGRGLHRLSHWPQCPSSLVALATDSSHTPRAAYSARYPSSSWSHPLISASKRKG